MARFETNEKGEQEIVETYSGELDDFLSIIDKLQSLFPKIGWDMRFEGGNLNKFTILCNDWDFYFTDKKFKNWTAILRKKFPKVKFFCAYLNFS